MPVIFQTRGYRFFFYSNEGSAREPPHVHVERDDREAKFWQGCSLEGRQNTSLAERSPVKG